MGHESPSTKKEETVKTSWKKSKSGTLQLIFHHVFCVFLLPTKVPCVAFWVLCSLHIGIHSYPWWWWWMFLGCQEFDKLRGTNLWGASRIWWVLWWWRSILVCLWFYSGKKNNMINNRMALEWWQDASDRQEDQICFFCYDFFHPVFVFLKDSIRYMGVSLNGGTPKTPQNDRV